MGVELGQAAVVADADLLESLARNLGEEGAELFAQLEVRRELLIFFRRKRGHINRVAGHALEQVVAHLLGDANAHDFLRLLGRARDVGRGDHVRVARELQVAWRLALKDVEAGPCHVTALERPEQIAFMDELAARGLGRASAKMRAGVCSPTRTAWPRGVFITTMPRLAAASRSTLSTPTPARPTARSLGARSSNSAVTFVALRTISASASLIA